MKNPFDNIKEPSPRIGDRPHKIKIFTGYKITMEVNDGQSIHRPITIRTLKIDYTKVNKEQLISALETQFNEFKMDILNDYNSLELNKL